MRNVAAFSLFPFRGKKGVLRVAFYRRSLGPGLPPCLIVCKRVITTVHFLYTFIYYSEYIYTYVCTWAKYEVSTNYHPVKKSFQGAPTRRSPRGLLQTRLAFVASCLPLFCCFSLFKRGSLLTCVSAVVAGFFFCIDVVKFRFCPRDACCRHIFS